VACEDHHPQLSLVVLIGPSGCGKSSFARKHFKTDRSAVVRLLPGLVSDDENAQAATTDAFEVLRFIARKRLAAGRLTVVDATNVQPESRKPLIELAREFHCCRRHCLEPAREGLPRAKSGPPRPRLRPARHPAAGAAIASVAARVGARRLPAHLRDAHAGRRGGRDH